MEKMRVNINNKNNECNKYDDWLRIRAITMWKYLLNDEVK